MRRQQLVSLWVWIRGLPRNPLTLPFIMAAAAGAAATIMMMRMSDTLGLIFVLIVVPLFFGLLSLVPRIGGALSLGGNIGAAIGIVAAVV